MSNSRYESNSDPSKCAHPNQVPFMLPKPGSPNEQEMHARCNDCGTEWPR